MNKGQGESHFLLLVLSQESGSECNSQPNVLYLPNSNVGV